MTDHPQADNLVHLIEPDASQRREVEHIIHESGLTVCTYDRAESLLRELGHFQQPTFGCVVSDLQLTDMSGLELQDRLHQGPHALSTVFFVKRARINDVVRAMRGGAVAVVEKCDNLNVLRPYIEEAIARSRLIRLEQEACAKTVDEIRKLSAGEQYVMRGILAGRLNKEIAQESNLSIRTIEQRRRAVFRKLNVQHPASLACKVLNVARNPCIPDEVREFFRSLAETTGEFHLSTSHAGWYQSSAKGIVALVSAIVFGL